MWWLDVRFSAAQSLPKNKTGAELSPSVTGQLPFRIVVLARPLQRGRKRQPPFAHDADQLGQCVSGVGAVVVQENDVPAPRGVPAEPRTQLPRRVTREILRIDVPEDDRLA